MVQSLASTRLTPPGIIVHQPSPLKPEITGFAGSVSHLSSGSAALHNPEKQELLAGISHLAKPQCGLDQQGNPITG